MNVDVAKVYGTILSIPGMSEVVKIDLKISRQNVLLLSNVIERGLSSIETDKSGLLSIAPIDSIEELKTLQNDCLVKAGLRDLNERLRDLSK